MMKCNEQYFPDRKAFLERVKNKSCLVVGDIILDKYIYGAVERISPEAPIPVVRVSDEKFALGGAANVAANIKGYHIVPCLCGVLGADENGEKVKELLAQFKIPFFGICTKRRSTVKTRVIGMNQQLVRVDYEEAQQLSVPAQEQLLAQVRKLLSRIQVIVLSDYNKGVCTEALCKAVIQMALEAGIEVIVDPKCRDWSKYQGAAIITPNFTEFKEAAGYSVENQPEAIGQAANILQKRYQIQQILVTRSRYGMTLVSPVDRLTSFQATQQEVYDVSGAGDTVVATIAAFLSAGFSPEQAVEISNYAAGLSVSKPGTYMVTLEEVIRYICKNGMWYRDKIVDRREIPSIIRAWRTAGERIVFTNGCFDILHAGHVTYLNEARRLGDKLVVGLNTDQSVRRLKGPARPINCQQARALALAAFQCVDLVVLFDEDTPDELAAGILPDVLVKGGDYRPEEVAGHEYAERVCIIPFVDGYSTTEIINKLKG